ncbi:hypothetical protein LPJ56_001268 [Coemansia sp. RSA 2599]|nr:hypothetical protein LPJ56_001268 [Coemansia sp. RSA 2599]
MLTSHHLYTARLFDAVTPVSSKLNLTAVSSRRSLLFVALGRHVSAYVIPHHTRPPVFKQRLAYAQPIPGDEINAITLGIQMGCEAVVAVYDSGRTVCWKADADFPVLWDRPGRVSTWGCAVHEGTETVATSANSFTITLLQSPRMVSGTGDAAEPTFHADELELTGHADNIPCVSFSTSGRYLASASIDFTIRVWSMSSKQPLFVFRYSQWCWAVAFVYPFYFMPVSGPFLSGQAGAGSAHEQLLLPGLGDAFFSGWSQEDEEELEQLEQGEGLFEEEPHDEELLEEEPHGEDEPNGQSQTSSQLESEYFEVSADYADESQSSEATSTSNGDVEAAPLHAIDHSEDIANGLATTEPPSASDSRQHSRDPRAAPDPIPARPVQMLEPEDGSPRLAHPLLLCSTRKDILLLDPSGSSDATVIVDRIEYVACRTPRPSLIDAMIFDRITVLEWIPDMAIVIAGSLSGTITIIKLETAIGSDDGSGRRYRMRRLFHLPESPVSRQLYGVSVYRHPIDTARFRAITLYIAYLDGRLMAYELFYPEDSKGIR